MLMSPSNTLTDKPRDSTSSGCLMASQVNKINMRKPSAGEMIIEEMKAEMFLKLRNMRFFLKYLFYLILNNNNSTFLPSPIIVKLQNFKDKENF